MNRSPSVIVVLADGARPDTLASAMEGGELPALARLSAEGGFHTIATVFPSVTGPAYAPFLMGRHPGSVGLPGLRWYDRSHVACGWPGYARSYIGYQCLRLDSDLDRESETIFELEPSCIGALSVIRRGLSAANQIGSGAEFLARAALTHFRGRAAGWLDIDRRIGERFVQRVADERPAFAFLALTGIDKASHAVGHTSRLVGDAMRVVDQTCAELRANAERDGTWDSTHLWVVSDHGHSQVSNHEDLAGFVGSLGPRTVAHPWIVRPGAQVAVAVSGNAMAHIYTGLDNRERKFWPALASRWDGTASAILARDSVDLMLLPNSETSCEIRTRGRGSGIVSWTDSTYSYRTTTGDPLGIGELEELTELDAFSATIDSSYPDALVQIARLSGCARSGDIILSAAPDWDFRARYEPIPHVSSHGALHREHMLVPLITNRKVVGTPRRTVDVMASACAALGLKAAATEGTSFLDAVPNAPRLESRLIVHT